MGHAITLNGVSKRFQKGAAAIHDVTLAIPPGDSLAIVGPSGSGKTTLLRLIAGLEQPTQGRITIDGSPATFMPPWERGVALVSQTPVFLPHRSVKSLMRGAAPRNPDGQAAVNRLAEQFQIEPFFGRRPNQISGGERQRVALARAFAQQAPILLLDEPLASLDPDRRGELRVHLATACLESQPTLILVTHDLTDALTLSKRMVVLVAGRVVDDGETQRVYHAPGCVTSARVLGDPPMNLLPCRIGRQNDRVLLRLDAADGQHDILQSATPTDHPILDDEAGFLGFRAHHATVLSESAAQSVHSGQLQLQCGLLAHELRGDRTLVRGSFCGTPFWSTSDGATPTPPRGRVQIDLSHCMVFRKESGLRIAAGLVPAC